MLAYVLVCCWALSGPVMGAEEPKNLLAGGGFEGAFADGAPAPWRRYGAVTSTTKLAPASIARSGRHSLLISDHNPGAEVGVSQQFPLPQGARFLVASVWVRAAPGGKGAGGFLQMRFLPSNKLVQTTLRAKGEGWEVCRVAGEAPAGTKAVVIYLYTHRGTICDTLVDDAEVIAVASREELLEASEAMDLSAFPPPPVQELKPLYLETAIVSSGKAAAAIVVPADGRYDELGRRIALQIRKLTGAAVPVVRGVEVRVPFARNLIILGNRSTNDLLRRLYDLYYTYLDLKYPGRGGWVVRTLHNPFGDGRNAVLLGGSDDEGVARAVDEFIAIARRAAGKGSLSVGWTMRIKLGEGLVPPEDADEAHAWEESAMYRGATYFGWNSISRRLALYYMTGNQKYLREFLWLAFPDDEAKKHIWKVDGERIEDKDHPLSGPYHYNAHHMILLWDLVEESPFFTEEQRLKITRAFAEQLRHWQAEWCYCGRHYGNPRVLIGSRHDQWAAVSLYCLSRYFQKYYPHAIWRKNMEAVQQYFGSFARTFHVAGELDHLWWYTTSYEPLVTYIILSGDRRGVDNGNLDVLLRGYDILLQGKRDGPYLRQLSLTFAHKCAYLTGDGRFLYYRDLTSLDTDIFRIGQSFWPTIQPREPTELVGKTLVRPLSPEEARGRLPEVPYQQAFQFAGYRSGLGDRADYILLDGFYGGSRNPYHCLALSHLRHGQAMLLNGYLNQVVVRQGGLVEGHVPLGAGLVKHAGFRRGAHLEAEVGRFFFGKWRRRMFHYTGHWTVIVDTFTPREDWKNLEICVQWQVGGAARVEEGGRVGFKVGESEAVLVPWEELPVDVNGRLVRVRKVVDAVAGQPVSIATVVGLEREGAKLDCLKADEEHAVVREGERAFAVSWSGTGEGMQVSGDGLTFFQARRVRWGPSAEFSIQDAHPAEALWDHESGTFEVCCAADTPIRLPVAEGAKAIVDGGKRLSEIGKVSAGRHIVSEAPMSPAVLNACSAQARRLLEKASRPRWAAPKPAGVDAPQLKPARAVKVGERVGWLVAGGGEGTAEIWAVGRKRVFPIVGGEVGKPVEPGAEITAVAFWPEERLLLVGCKDDKVYAYRGDGTLAWTFKSEMHPDVRKTGKTYWFKSALPGISGLATGNLTGKGTQAFVGSACTIEVIDAQGKLIRRLPQYWGSVWRMAVLSAGDGSRKLLAAKMPNGVNNIGIIDGRTWSISYGFTGLPAGHTAIAGWSSMNTPNLIVADLDGDGAEEVIKDVNGSWNRVVVYDAGGKPLWSHSFGPSLKYWHRHMRGLAVVDLQGDGKREVIAAEEGGIVTAFDAAGKRLWHTRLAQAPETIAAVPLPKAGMVAAGCSDGSVYLLDGGGRVVGRARVGGQVTALICVGAGKETALCAGTSEGELALIPLP